MESIQYIIQWFCNNKEWIFSGVGVGVVIALWNIIICICRRMQNAEFIKTYNLEGEWSERWSVQSENYSDLNEDLAVKIIQRGKRVSATFQASRRKYRLDGVINPQRYLTGTWGDIETGATYHGAFQLRISPNWDTMEGVWIGFDSKSTFKSGRWQWKRPDVAKYPSQISHEHSPRFPDEGGH